MKKALFTMTLCLSSLMTWAGNRPVGHSFSTRSEIIARNGMAATSQPLATQAALQILKEGGTAVDAAIAANAVLGLVEPTGCGIGGDLFALVWDPKTHRLHGLNGSGRRQALLGIWLQHQRIIKTLCVPVYRCTGTRPM